MNLRPAIPADIPFMMELERTCPAAAHWTERQYRQAVQPDGNDPERLVLVAEASPPAAAGEENRDSGSSIVGFLVARHLASEWELENIVVGPAVRQRGLGRRFLDALLSAARKTDRESVFLEVRESNMAARKLYEKGGFQQTGRRKCYYTDPPEDAILYRRSPA
jgi:ribosomal-protein-alanine N-acetyltransferase